MALVNNLKYSFFKGHNLTKVLYINIAVFLFFKFLDVFIFLIKPEMRSVYNPIAYLMLPADIDILSQRPWTLFTYMFLHSDFFHILFNMLWLYWFGKIFLQYIGNRSFLPVYLAGGLLGAFFYIGAFNIFPVFAANVHSSMALGASAGVIAVVVAIAFFKPDYELNLLFLGAIKLKYIAMVTIIIDFLSIPSLNSGGHIAHLGGAALGGLFAWQYGKGKNILKWMERFFEWIVNPKPRMKVSKPKYKVNADKLRDDEYNYEKTVHQTEIDRILDKIASSGYESLSKDEKEKLFNASKK